MEDRFKKIEDKERVRSVVRKKKWWGRFEHLETGPRDIRETIKKEKYFKCPRCKRPNNIDALYCIYCGYVFPDRAEKVDSELEVYEIRCPFCGKIGNRNQKRCIWCGHSLISNDEEILREGDPIEVTIDGIKYSSKDPYLPTDIKKLLIRIKKERLTSEEIENLIMEIKMKKLLAALKIETEIEKKTVWPWIILFAGIFLLLFTCLLFFGNPRAIGTIVFFILIAIFLIVWGVRALAIILKPQNSEKSLMWRTIELRNKRWFNLTLIGIGFSCFVYAAYYLFLKGGNNGGAFFFGSIGAILIISGVWKNLEFRIKKWFHIAFIVIGVFLLFMYAQDLRRYWKENFYSSNYILYGPSGILLTIFGLSGLLALVNKRILYLSIKGWVLLIMISLLMIIWVFLLLT